MLDSGSVQVCSPLAQVKAAATHVRRLKRNQKKEKISPEFGGIVPAALVLDSLSRAYNCWAFPIRVMLTLCFQVVWAIKTFSFRNPGLSWATYLWLLGLFVVIHIFRGLCGFD
jgi:uncharacterized membrane protein YfhO